MRTILYLSLVCIGCSSSKSEAPRSAPATSNASLNAKTDAAAIAVTPPPTPAPARVACSSDGDCMNSCSQGAVNRAWWQLAFPGDEGCEDGCADASIDSPRCLANRCVAYDVEGARSAECTDVDRTPELIGPAHHCSVDADCTNTCAYGAVNQTWHRHHGKKACKDGCVAKGFEKPKCEANLCVAYRNGAREESCTMRSIW